MNNVQGYAILYRQSNKHAHELDVTVFLACHHQLSAGQLPLMGQAMPVPTQMQLHIPPGLLVEHYVYYFTMSIHVRCSYAKCFASGKSSKRITSLIPLFTTVKF